MKRLVITTLCALAISEIAALATAHPSLPIDPPVPPPCCPDGNCYPNQEYWGHYPGRWRQWPGADLTPKPSGRFPTPAPLPSEMNANEPPAAEKEDVQAPPSSTKKKPEATSESKSGEGGAEKSGKGESEPLNLPGLPPLPGAPGPMYEAPGPKAPGPRYETPQTVTPKESTSDADPPPALPSALS